MGVLAAAAIVAGALAAYRNSFSGPFIFDDILGIERNPSIRSLWPLTGPLNPKTDTTLTGRPFANLSFALSYRFGGLDVTGYHEANLLIHVLAGLALFGIVRRTLRRAGPGSLVLAFVAALLWTVHPLQTESVTYVVQRVESLMGLLYFLTLYCFIRGAERESASGAASVCWFGLSWLACLLGMATKEVMVSAPVIVFLYDRTFIGGSFLESWRRRRGFHLCLAATWALVAWLALGTNGRNGTSGFGVGVKAWDYYLTQFPAVVRYLELSLWPRPLLFDYGTQWVAHPVSVIPDAMIVVAGVAGTLWALRRRPAVGFLGAWFFSILAPTSLIPGNRQTMAEHRMYLALAPVIIAGTLALDRICLRLFPDLDRRRASRALLFCGLAAAVVLAALTARRNLDFRTEQAIWEDTVAKNPDNAYPRNNLGNVYLKEHRLADAIAQYREVVRLQPDYAMGHNNLGTALLNQGKRAEALEQFDEALRLKSDYPDLHNNIGVALIDTDVPRAIAEFETLLRDQPDFAGAHFNLGNALARVGRLPEAVAQYKEALRLDPGIAQVYNNLGLALDALNRLDEAEEQFVAAVQVDPGFVEAYTNLGNALLKAGRPLEAIHEYQRALRLRPGYVDAHFNLANALLRTGSLSDAESEYREALRLRPNYAAARINLGDVLAREGQLDAAVSQFSEAVRLRPDDALAQNDLGGAFLRQRQTALAERHLEAALRLKPDYAEAHNNLANALLQDGHPADAIPHYQEALRLKFDSPELRNNLGSALFGLGRLGEARRQFEAALRLKPDFPDARANLDNATAALGGAPRR